MSKIVAGVCVGSAVSDGMLTGPAIVTDSFGVALLYPRATEAQGSCLLGSEMCNSFNFSTCPSAPRRNKAWLKQKSTEGALYADHSQRFQSSRGKTNGDMLGNVFTNLTGFLGVLV